MDELVRIETRIARLRRIMNATCHNVDMFLGSPLHHEIDRLVARHARISMNRYRNRLSPPGTRTS